MDEDKTEDQQIESTEAEESPAETTEQVEQVEQELTETPDEAQASEVDEAPAEQEQAEAPAPPSRRENLRIQQVLSRLKQQPQREEPQRGLDYRNALDAPDEVYDQLEQDRQSYGTQAYQQGIRQAETIEWKTTLRLDNPVVHQKYPELDPKSNNFDASVADALNEEYLYYVGYSPGDKRRGIPESVERPDISYADFVESKYELANRIAGQKVQQSSKNIARQAASTGLRPDGSSAKSMNLSKDPSQMTQEELDAKIKQDLKSLKTIR